MIRYQKNKNSMYETVLAYVEENRAVYSGTEEFTSSVINLRSVMDQIKAKEDESSSVTTGKTKNKNVTKESVCRSAILIAGALYAAGKKTGNVVLSENADISKSFLRSLRNHDLVIKLGAIKDLAVENREIIVSYGVTDDKYTDFLTRVEMYTTALSAKSSSGAAKSSAIKSLKQLFKEGDDILDILDRLNENYIESNTAFYNGYKAARVIKNLGIRHDQPAAQKAMDKLDKLDKSDKSVVPVETNEEPSLPENPQDDPSEDPVNK